MTAQTRFNFTDEEFDDFLESDLGAFRVKIISSPTHGDGLMALTCGMNRFLGAELLFLRITDDKLPPDEFVKETITEQLAQIYTYIFGDIIAILMEYDDTFDVLTGQWMGSSQSGTAEFNGVQYSADFSFRFKGARTNINLMFPEHLCDIFTTVDEHHGHKNYTVIGIDVGTLESSDSSSTAH